MNCEKCFDVTLGYATGEVDQRGNLDCAHCNAATERTALNAAMRDVCLTTKDQDWHAYQLGKAAALAEMLPMLRKMWGHAIELGETDYFDDEQFEKEQYRQDCIEAAKLIAACKKA